MWLLGLLACLGGGIRHEVALGDLAPLGTKELAALKDEEHAVTVAQTMIEGARAEADRADARLDEARALREQAKLEHETAKATLDAARASRDPLRIGAAEGMEVATQRDLDAAEARLGWQEAADRVAEDAIDLGEVRLEYRQAELELARYELLSQAGQGFKYRRADFVDQRDNARDAYEEAQRSHDELKNDAGRAWEEWRQYEQYPATEPSWQGLEG